MMVGLEQKEDTAAWREDGGWIPGVNHSVVLLDVRNHREVDVADPSPSIQRECWTTRDLQRLWRNCGMRLVKRTNG
jgi:hypothetical protein